LERKESAAGGGGGGITEPVDSLQWDTTFTGGSTAPGLVAWDTSNETLQFMLDSNVTLQIGQEHVIRVKNSSGSVAIPEFSVVMFAGATGDTVKVSPAVTDGTVSADYIVGITTEEIPADGFGFVTQFGFINKVDTSVWSLGTILYPDASNPGQLTSTIPTAPALKIPIAAVTRQHAVTGRVLVRSIPGHNLDGLHDVSITSVSSGQFLRRNSGNTAWINETVTLPAPIPSGVISQFAGSSAPTGYLLCEGQTISRTTYSDLFAVVGTTYGAGDGSTTFALPDLRTRVPVGKNASGTFANLGATGGAESITLTAAQSGLPAHSHANTLSDPGHNHTQVAHTHTQNAHGHSSIRVNGNTTLRLANAGGSGVFGLTTGGGSTIDVWETTATNQNTTAQNNANTTGVSINNVNNTAANASQAHSNLQPFIVLNYIIKT
jgi:microcystin-dependent protein